MSTILDEILTEKKKQIEILLVESASKIERNVERPSLFDRLYYSENLQVISEIKRASPSKGIIAKEVDPALQAKVYYEAGATCISVLTDTPFFKGSFEDLATVARTVPIPVLCKDFIIHPVQIDHAKNAGASVILLIVAALKEEELKVLFEYASTIGLEVLVEVHDETELNSALKVGAKIIGVNNRDLRTFDVDLARTDEIAAIFPFQEERVLISESGIWKREDAERVARVGASGVLVGESLMRSENINNVLQDLQVVLGGILK
ncbi:indole-3-glycerol phosphate synthase TrpC [Bacillus sp. FJAT-22090]|uniref:indole-3-glycerol phosphate synthase TrpC n=1 Tax=Bacillus sp. FJAT-22090 TaxID=1581038 RepID=UPI00119D9CBF|nr:indole-3-glycerol phosphate synthase TrpC [Bacillus sp. FJAT-22090]